MSFRRDLCWLMAVLGALLLASPVSAVPPRLLGGQMFTQRVSFLDEPRSLAQVQLQFDQELYLNDGLLCPHAELGCQPPPLATCRPCDLTDASRADFWDVCSAGPLPCCGAWLYPESSDAANVREWCAPSTPFAQLAAPSAPGQSTESAPFRLAAGEQLHLRFFLPAELWCSPVRLRVRHTSGATDVFYSTRYALPGPGAYDWAAQGLVEGYGYGQTFVDLCPNFHPHYLPASYAVTVSAHYDSQFTVGLFVGAAHPIPPPSPSSLRCVDAPLAALNASYCVDEAVTTPMTLINANPWNASFAQVVLPVRPGCQVITITATPTVDDWFQLGTDVDIYCLAYTASSVVDYSQSITGRYRTGGDTLTLTVCMDQPRYLRCGLQAWIEGDVLFTWATTQPVHRVLATAVPRYDFGMSSGLASSGVVFFDSTAGRLASPFNTLCIDWSDDCETSRPLYPSANALPFFPPQSYDLPGDAGVPLPADSDLDGPSPPDATLVSFAAFFLDRGAGTNVVPFTLADFAARGSIVLLSFTNAAGELPALPGGGPGADSFAYVPHVGVPALQRVELPALCSLPALATVNADLQQHADALRNSSDYAAIAASTYEIELLSASPAFQSCLLAVVSLLDTNTTTEWQQLAVCPYTANASAYADDPCCSVDLRARACCRPQPVRTERVEYSAPTTAALASCTEAACARSYLGDLAALLVSVDGVLTTTCQLPDDSGGDTAALMSALVRRCRAASGFGVDFTGVPCSDDADCAALPPAQCDAARGVCRTRPLADAESDFLACFVAGMPSSFDDFLRQTQLPAALAAVDRTSPDYLAAVAALLTEPDCRATSPLQLAPRTKLVYAASDPGCQAYNLGLGDSAWSAALVELLCPPAYCLDSDCGVPPRSCQYACNAAWQLDAADAEQCGQQTECSVLVDDCDQQLGAWQCAFCPADGSPCLPVDGVSSEAECTARVACELADGSFALADSAEQCRAMAGHCSVPCYGDAGGSCRSALGLDGLCEYSDATTPDDCQTVHDGFFYQGVCLAAGLQPAVCQTGGVWRSCSALPAASCDLSTPAAAYLQCYALPFVPCASASACQAAGLCSDWQSTLVFDASAPGQVSDGACFSSGFYQVYVPDGTTECFSGSPRTANGCRLPTITQPERCTGELVDRVYLATQWLQWRTHARSEAACLDPTAATSAGCSFTDEYRTLWYDADECEACGGHFGPSWSWQTGRWLLPAARPLSWQQVQRRPASAWGEALSFLRLGQLIDEFVAYRASFALKSRFLCAYEGVRVPLAALACSCLAGDSGCFAQLPRSRPVGVARPCSGEPSTVYTPSAALLFADDSVAGTCVLLELGDIPSAAVAVPAQPPALSAQLARPEPPTSPVVNSNGRVVGRVVSNGVVLSTLSTQGSRLANFELCLLVEDDDAAAAVGSGGLVADFGHLDGQLIHPQAYSVRVVSAENGTGAYWCAALDGADDGNDVLFAVARDANYQSGHGQTYSDQDVALSYTLGALYSALLLLLCGGLVWLLALLSRPYPVYLLALPAFIVLAVFRVVYAFALPSDVWVDNDVASYAVFELPTFCYFSAVLLIFWSQLSVLVRIQHRSQWWKSPLVVAALLLWALFVAVLVAAAALVGQDSNTGCPGRVPQSNDTDQNVRALSLAYQSIVVAFCLVLSAGLAYVSASFFRMVEGSSKQRVSILREVFKDSFTIAAGFTARCVAFIVYLAIDLDSSVYIFVTLVLTEIAVVLVLVAFWIIRSANKDASTDGSSSKRSFTSPQHRHSMDSLSH